MNPYVIIAIMIVIDIITLPFIIKKMLKKEGKHKGVKIAILIVAFVAVEALCSFFFIDSAKENTWYDRFGNKYEKAESVVYYDKAGNEFLLCETAGKQMYFISGAKMREPEKTYIDKDGYLVYDSKNRFSETEKPGVYADENGNEYYRADDVRWNEKGGILIIEE